MKIIKYQHLTWAIGLLVMAYLIYQGPRLVPDSNSFIYAGPTRSAGYPLIIIFIQMIFGKYAIGALFYVQLFLTLFSIQYFLKYLKSNFNLSDLITFLISFIFYFYFYRIGGKITSEPFSFILLLFSIKYLLEAVFNDSIKSMYIFYALLVFLVLVRGQFYFLYPIVLFVIVFSFYKNRNWNLSIKYLAFLIATIIVTNLADRTYHFAKHGRFIGTPFTGLQIVTDALYVAQETDSNLFENELEKEMFARVYANISDQELILENLKRQNPDVGPGEIIYHYNYTYNKICHENTKIIVGSYFEDPENIDYWKSIDEVTLNMAIKLIQRHPVEFLKLYIYDILRNGYFSNIFLIFFLIVLVFGLIAIYQDPEDKTYFFLVLSSLIVISNFLLVALVEPILDRYSFYGNILYYTSMFIVVANGYNHSLKKYRKTEHINE